MRCDGGGPRNRKLNPLQLLCSIIVTIRLNDKKRANLHNQIQSSFVSIFAFLLITHLSLLKRVKATDLIMTTGSVASSIDIEIYSVDSTRINGDNTCTSNSGTYTDRKHPEDAYYIEQGSHAGSEMSSIGLSSPEDQMARPDNQPHRPLSQFEEISRTAMISSQQRRAQRRQWNPSYHSSAPPVAAWAAAPIRQISPPVDPPAVVFPPSPPPDVNEKTKSAEASASTTAGAVEFTEDVEAAAQPAVTTAAVIIETADVATATALDAETGQTPNFRSNSSSHSELQSETYQVALAVTDTSPDDSGDESAASSNHVQFSTQSYFTVDAATDSKYEAYTCLVDRSQNDKSLEIHLYSLKRPHMRAFHLAWMAFFAAFFTWFSITPLLAEVQRSLDLTRKEIWTSSTYGVAGSVVTRILIGPLCDKYGARWAMAGTLVVSAIPTGLTGLVNTATGLNMLRLVIGVAGSAFVTCQYWTSSMFTVEVAGTANALVAGWGNLGGGVTQIVMGTLLFPLFKIIYGGDAGKSSTSHDDDDDESSFDRPSDLAWRTVCVVPAILCFLVAYVVVKKSDDCPKGNYSKLSRQGYITKLSAMSNLRKAFSGVNTWILFLQYGCCFGVEITMVNGAALYFKEVFGQSTESAAALASIFGWMNLFARGVGGFVSDMLNAKFGMRGRLWFQVVTLILEGCFVILFGRIESLGGAIAVMVVLSIFVQAAEGSTFGIVPYVQHSVTGSIAGVVGAGGNVGGVVFAILFREYDYRDAFLWMGLIAMCSAVLSFITIIRGHASLLVGEDCPDVLQKRSDHNESFGNMPPLSTGESNGCASQGIGSIQPQALGSGDQDISGHSAASKIPTSSRHSSIASNKSLDYSRSYQRTELSVRFAQEQEPAV
jgi:NNP family nitrate/nitrite transporter-like MFS transporter